MNVTRSWTPCGSSPAVGSSRTSTSGSIAMTPAIATRFFSPAAQVVGDPVGKVFDPDDPEGFMHPVVDRLLIKAKVGRAECHVLLDGRGEDLVVRVLEDDPDKLAHLADVLLW